MLVADAKTVGGVELLDFQQRTRIQEKALEAFGGGIVDAASVTTAGEGATILVGDMLTDEMVAFLRTNKSAKAKFRKVSRNAAKRGVAKIQRAVSSEGLVDSRLFISSWRGELTDESGTGLVMDISFTNTAPYALYVHPKNTSPSSTFVNDTLPGVVDDIADEVRVDLQRQVDQTKAAMARAAKKKRKR